MTHHTSGMDPNGLPSNQIIWAGNYHILIDINAPTLATLSSLGLSPRNITHVVITHMHEDHVAGALAYMEWCKRNRHPIRLIIEPGIYELFKEQAKQILNRDIKDVYDIQIIPLAFYKDTILGEGEEKVLIEPVPAFHGTPATMLRFTYKNHTISHSSDTTFDPVRFERILQNMIPDNIREELRKYAHAGSDVPVFDRRRSDELTEFLLRPNQSGRRPEVIIYEGGNAGTYEQNNSNHTTPFALQKLPEEIQHAIYVNHTAKLPVGASFSFRHAAPFSTVKVELKTNIPVVSDISSVNEPSALAKSAGGFNSTLRPEGASSAVSLDKGELGGIDFRTLPIVTQAMSNLSLNAPWLPLSRLDSINLNQEWQEIQKMVEAGIIPSTERIKEYVQLSCLKGELSDKQKIISCIADILRDEEERCSSTESTLKDILVVLESGRPAQELKAVFTDSRT